ncbi:hypothetical protein SAMN04487981_104114 [Streptomyces sp. cf386]|uniref:hypothetical protein n=1 Tax=Streptomyces sp. cf386 TaxID=1761904 RepID=UPI0008894006|nr:hypothetical protein [Streptomyces sp. cf386]SDN22044.1 hypothetical protein SAMN04487981_104114 [Streptomyces sp. cf386]
MSRTQLAHGSLTSLAAALTLLTTGCAEKADGTQVAADACRAADGWTAEKRAEWLRTAVSFPDEAAAEDAAVVIGSHTGEPLCEPIAVQVQFWEATATRAGTDLRSVLRIRLNTDGSRSRTIGFPAGLSPAERDDCTGVLMAAYPGVPLTQTELPATAPRLTPASTTADIPFGTTRVAAQRLLPPTSACGTPAEPTPNPWGSDHP